MASETGVASGFGDDLDFEWDPQGHVGRGNTDQRSNDQTEASGGREEQVGSWGASGSSRGAGRGRATQPSGRHAEAQILKHSASKLLNVPVDNL